VKQAFWVIIYGGCAAAEAHGSAAAPPPPKSDAAVFAVACRALSMTNWCRESCRKRFAIEKLEAPLIMLVE